MKDKLEKYVEEHRREFNDLEPSDGLWDRISDDLPQKTGINYPLFVRVAAAVLLMAASYIYYVNTESNQQPAETTASAMQEQPKLYRELKEAEIYYTTKISETKDELFVVLDDQPELKQDIESELKELNEAYTELEDDLMDNASNEEIIEYMIQNHRLKLQILEQMLHQIKRARNYEEDIEDERFSL